MNIICNSLPKLGLNAVMVDHSIKAIKELKPNPDNVYVFDQFDTWHPYCFSAILKLLEENDNFIIVGSNLPEAIYSRCVVVNNNTQPSGISALLDRAIKKKDTGLIKKLLPFMGLQCSEVLLQSALRKVL